VGLQRLESVRVWDPVVRLSHWIVAFGCIANLSFLRHGDDLHDWAGYAVLAAVVFRIFWGFVASGHANFRSFFPSPRRLLVYLGLLLRRREPRYIGHNPAGAAMMLALIGLVVTCGVTGWMLGLDAFWGDSTVEGVHIWAANAILFLLVFHVAGAIVESIRHSENLILAMITGRKRGPASGDVD
jgi:cytochrome b